MNPFNSYGSTKECAKSLLAHYFERAMSQPLDSDNYSEIGNIVDCILQAVEEQTVEYRLKNLEQSVIALKRSHNQAIASLEKAQDFLIDLGGTE